MFRHQRAIQLLAVFGTVALTLTAVWIWGARHNHMPCISDCGETFIAQMYARNWRLFGLEFGLVEDHATSPSSEAHPYYYTHNVNIGGLYYVLLESLGIGSFAAKQFFVLLIFGIGLFYAYAAVRLHTRSSLAGYCVLVAACLDFGFFSGFGLHALRAWSWMALFGLVLHVGRFAASPFIRFGNAGAILVFSAVAFGIGYDFWIVSTCVAIATYYFFSSASNLRVRRLGLVALLVLIPFGLRQVHIAAVMGVDYWMKDFVYSFAAKIPFASRVFELPPKDVLEFFYRSYNVLRPPTAEIHAASDYGKSLLALGVATFHVILPLAGLLTLLATVAGSVCGVLISLRSKWQSTETPVKLPGLDQQGCRLGIDLLGSAKLLAALAIGLGLGALIVPRMVAPFYFALGMPMVGALIVAAKGVFIAILIATIHSGSVGKAMQSAVVILLLALVVDHGLVQAANIRAAKPMDTSWVPVVQARPKATYAVSFIAPAVAGFTENWAVGISSGREWEMLEAISLKASPFTAADLLWFGERDVDRKDSAYLKPDYWLYFPIDRRAAFISVEPDCRKDYLSHLLGKGLAQIAKPQNLIDSSWIHPPHAKAGSTITVGLKLKPHIQVQGISLSVDGAAPIVMSLNCIKNVALAKLRLPDKPEEAMQRLRVAISLKHDRHPIAVDLGVVQVSSAGVGGIDAPLNPRPQPTVTEILSRYPKLPIASLRVTDNPWEGYLLIDLRAIHGRSLD